VSRQGHSAASVAGAAAATAAAEPAAGDGALRLYNTLTRQKEVFTPRPDQARARAGARRAQRAVAPLAG
jgi:hypothetical protein